MYGCCEEKIDVGHHWDLKGTLLKRVNLEIRELTKFKGTSSKASTDNNIAPWSGEVLQMFV